MIRSISLVLLIFLLSCEKDEQILSEPFVPNPPAPPTPVTINTWLALGDSYTIGQGVPQSDRYPAQTVAKLKESGIKIDTLRYIATTGWTTNDLMNAIAERKPVNHTVVSLLIGVNDQYQGVDSSVYRKRFRDALGKAISLANGKKENVIVISIPDYSVTPYSQFADTVRIRKELDAFNMINKEETALYGCPYLDITPSTRLGRTQRELIAADGLHPSGMEYLKWAKDLSPMLERILK
ncbi:MAG: SGNH/GDSL hydrolase family protein [Chitinophagia bacterium]|jgi:lysophospholipase L1-like esterase